MKILKINNIPVIEYENLYLTKELNKEKVLTFTLSPKHHKLIANEVLVELSGHRYRVKEFTKDTDNRVEVYCEYDVSDLESVYYDEKKEYTNTIQVTLYQFLQGTGYDLKGDSLDKVRKLSGTNKDLYQVINEARKIYSVEIEIDNKTKTIKYWKKQGDQDSNVILSKDLNITKLHHTADTHEYFNVIEPRGKEGLTIESVNNGSKFLKADRLEGIETDVYHFWEDERYEVAENLLEDAKELLAIHSKPLEVFEIDLLDLSSEKGYEAYKLDLGDSAKVWGLNEKHRVVKIVVNVNNEKDKIITLSNKPVSLSDQSLELQDLIDRNDAKQDGKLQQAQKDFRDRFNKQKEEIDKDLEDYKNEFDIELANAPQTTVEWLNKHTGVLNGDTLMIESIKSKHIESGSIETHHIEAGAITSQLITVDKLLADEISSKVAIADLIMAGRIEGNNSWWDLDKGEFKNYNSDKSSVVNIQSGMMKLTGKQTERSTTLTQDGFEIRRFKDIEHNLSLTNYTMSTRFGTISENIYAGTAQSPMREKIISYEYTPTDSYIGQASINVGDTTTVWLGDLGAKFGHITVTKEYLQRIEDRITALERGR